MWQRWGVSYVTGASNWYWLPVGQGLLSKGRGGMHLFLLFLHSHSCSSFFPVPLSSPLLSLLYLFSLSLGDDTKYPTRVDVSLNPNTIKNQHNVCWSCLPLHISGNFFFQMYSFTLFALLGGSVRCVSDWWSGSCGFDPHRLATFFCGDLIMKYFLFYTVIMKENIFYFIQSFSFPLIQEGQLSVSGERMCSILVNRLEY